MKRVRGGATRSESVRAALAAGGPGDVLVHDAARPLVEPDLFTRVVDALAHADCAIAAARVVDTIKEAELCVPAVKNGEIAEDLDGDGVLDGFERWYYGNTANGAASDTDSDGSTLLDEFLDGSDPTDSDTDDDGSNDGADATPQDRLLP